MLVKDLFEQLSYGEFRKYGVGNDDGEGIQPADYPRVMPFVKLALTALHKKFLLRSSSVMVQQYGYISRYSLTNEHRQTDSTPGPTKYIMDTSYEPFEGSSLLKIEQIFSEVGDEYPLNDNGAGYSLFTPEYNVVEIAYPRNENAMNVIYRADHLPLKSAGEDVPDQTINVSPAYMELLLMHIAGRYLMSSGSVEKESTGANLLSRFEAGVIDLKSNGLNQAEVHTNMKLELRGWR
tara:strand:- start:2456 stop:3163 length:708 start_codon:yes stop_codon:yes gene_type:complete